MIELFNQEEDKYRSIFELSPEAIGIIDTKGNITAMNGRVYDWLGFKPEEVIGKNLSDIPFLSKESLIRAQENFKKRMLGEEVPPYELEFITKEGEKVIGRVTVSRIEDRKGKIAGIIVMISDITQRKVMELKLKESEEKYRNIIDSSPDAITITDLNGKIVNCNQATLELYGFSKKEDCIGMSAFNFISQKDHQRATKNMAKTLKEGSVKNIEYTLLTKDGREFPGDLSASVIYNDKNKPILFMAITRDISERKRIEQTKSEFTSLASHQLRTPLSIMGWYTEMLLKGKAGAINKQQKKYLKEIYNANDNLVKLVNLLLNISRIELGTFVVNPSEIDLVKTINSALKDLSREIKEKKLKIEKKYSQKSFFLNTDQNIMNIVFQNLLSNAVRYTSDKGKVEISIAKKETWVLVQISDTGYGIPASQQSQIFSRFFRAENIKGKEATGIGLGLYIAKSVLQQIGGEIWFKSKEKEGTTFYVKIPSK